MDIINWKNAFSVGVDSLDAQHKKLLGMINRLIEDQKSLTDPKMIAELLTEMTDYAEEHFHAEEYLMSEYGYEEKDQQVIDHKEFIKKTRAFYSKTEIGPNILSTALLDYLSKWLINHILHEDMKYKMFFQSKGVQ
jgi:hemerythrin